MSEFAEIDRLEQIAHEQAEQITALTEERNQAVRKLSAYEAAKNNRLAVPAGVEAVKRAGDKAITEMMGSVSAMKPGEYVMLSLATAQELQVALAALTAQAGGERPGET